MSIDEHKFQINSPILFGFRTSEIKIDQFPFASVTTNLPHSFTLLGRNEAIE
jgi:hypothetical protein